MIVLEPELCFCFRMLNDELKAESQVYEELDEDTELRLRHKFDVLLSHDE